jgi:CrcB protein
MIAAPWWQQLLLVMAGGAVGAGLRFTVGAALLRWWGNALPWGTLAVNVVGAFFAGMLLVWLQGRGESASWLRALLVVGLLGGLTTFSSLMVELLVFTRAGRSDLFLLYLGLSLVLGFAAVWSGARVATQLVG